MLRKWRFNLLCLLVLSTTHTCTWRLTSSVQDLKVKARSPSARHFLCVLGWYINRTGAQPFNIDESSSLCSKTLNRSKWLEDLHSMGLWWSAAFEGRMSRGAQSLLADFSQTLPSLSSHCEDKRTPVSLKGQETSKTQDQTRKISAPMERILGMLIISLDMKNNPYPITCVMLWRQNRLITLHAMNLLPWHCSTIIPSVWHWQRH